MIADVQLSECPNCGAALNGAFCARCGQKAAPLNPSFKEFLHELFHELAHVDGKIIQAVRLLLTRPGFLSREHFEGRRARYVSPIRLYLACSVLFFAVTAFSPLTGPQVHCTSCSPEEKDQVELEMREAIAHWAPRAMFVLVPVFAGLVTLTARRSGRHYPEHLYFAMHVHAAWFCAGALAAVAGLARVPAFAMTVSLAMTVYGAFYFVLAFRRAYGASWIRAVLGTAAVSLTYMLAVSVTLLAIVLTVIAERSKAL